MRFTAALFLVSAVALVQSVAAASASSLDKSKTAQAKPRARFVKRDSSSNDTSLLDQFVDAARNLESDLSSLQEANLDLFNSGSTLIAVANVAGVSPPPSVDPFGAQVDGDLQTPDPEALAEDLSSYLAEVVSDQALITSVLLEILNLDVTPIHDTLVAIGFDLPDLDPKLTQFP